MLRLPALLTLAVVAAVAPSPRPPTQDAPAYTSDGQLTFPANYHEWVFLGAGLDMSYDKAAAPSTHSVFNTVYANPAEYGQFKQTGHWPEGTQLVLENRGAISDASINREGKTMSSELMGLEVHVLDSRRAAATHQNSAWTFYSFSNPVSAKPIPTTTDCYSCHQQHGAVDTTFVQFYPTLLGVAHAKQTLSPHYLHDEQLRPATQKQQ